MTPVKTLLVATKISTSADFKSYITLTETYQYLKYRSLWISNAYYDNKGGSQFLCDVWDNCEDNFTAIHDGWEKHNCKTDLHMH